jgi:hypothetical protein
MASLNSPTSVSGLPSNFIRRPNRGIKVIADDTPNPKEERLRESYTRLNTTSQTLDEKLAELYQPTFKVPIAALTGTIKRHGLYQVQSSIQIRGDKLIKVSAYTFTKDKLHESVAATERDHKAVFEIAKQDIQAEVIYQELAGHMESPFSVPKIFRFNYYDDDDMIITLIEMQYIVSSRPPTIAELKMANDFLAEHGIFHNDLVINGNYLDESTVTKELYNTSNMIVDADGTLWVIDFGAASDVIDKPRGGKRKSRKRKKYRRKTAKRQLKSM